MTKYYLNNPCEVLSTFEDKTVIRISKEFCMDWNNYEPPSYECVDVETIVLTNQLTDAPIKISEEFKQLEEKKMEVEKEIKQIRNKLEKEKQEAKKEIENIKKEAEKFNGLTEMYHYLNGDYQYVILTEYWRGAEIKKLDECFCQNSSNELASVSFRVKDYNKKQKFGPFKMYIGQYSDDSGSKYEAKGFETLEDAKRYYVKNCLEQVTDRTLDECEKWGITCEKIENYKQEMLKKKEEARIAKKKNLQAQLDLLK
jgi:molecular chaperone GrpE (heat shock protein)